MVKIETTTTPLGKLHAEGYVILVEQDTVLTPQVKEIAKRFNAPLEPAIKNQEFKGNANTSIHVLGSDKSKLVHIILVGQGKKENASVEQYRRALGNVIRLCEIYKIEDVAILFPNAAHYTTTPTHLARETAVILDMTAYYFDQFITDESRKVTLPIVTLVINEKQKKEIETGLAFGIVLGEAVNNARLWVDLPPHHMSPEILASKAREIAKKYKLKATIFNEQECIKMGMGGIEAVAKGSELDAYLAILEYKTTKKNAPTLAIVGKGITFDSGGLSIKPAGSMESMKEDMAGAAAVIATMQVVAELKPEINVIAVAPIAENMPSGTAVRPGDIVTFYNGKTAEIKNTDAEGRLILADALSYTVKQYKPDALIDLATLTGSCAASLGAFYAGLMSQHPTLANKIKSAVPLSGERVWELPLDPDFKKAIYAEVADMCNSGNRKYMAGAITAAFFLQNFVGDTEWAHLDIAGTAFGVPDISYYRSGAGATGYGVRLLTDIILNWNK